MKLFETSTPEVLTQKAKAQNRKHAERQRIIGQFRTAHINTHKQEKAKGNDRETFQPFCALPEKLP